MNDPIATNNLSDPWWRLNNLYKIKNKEGKVVTFKWNWAQEIFYKDMWYLNIILKARQLGITTAIQIFMLDRTLFNDNTNCGIVAHNKEDAEAFFSDKIKFAYDNLPNDLRKARKATSDSKRSLIFSNGSSIRVGTSLRSGTYQYVHISEFGKLCAKFPEKAKEVITGTLNTVAPGQMVFIESTAEGPFGNFYDMCQAARAMLSAVTAGDISLTKMDYRFFFFAWWKHPDYVLNEKVAISDDMASYFKELREEHDIDLTPAQKAWYCKKKEEQGDKMKQEYPATPDEAFESTGELVIYGKQLRQARETRRIGNFPMVRGVPVNTYWDLGRNDMNSIWFHQHLEGFHRFSYYMEDRLEDLTYYVDQLFELKRLHGWIYGKHYLPHDVKVTDISSRNQESREEILRTAGLTPIIVVPKIPRVNDGIELTRRIFSQCQFDAEGCEVGLRALHNYQWAFDDLHGIPRDTPAKTWGRNGADAFRQFSQGYRGKGGGFKAQQVQFGINGGGGRKYAREGKRQDTLTDPDTKHVV